MNENIPGPAPEGETLPESGSPSRDSDAGVEGTVAELLPGGGQLNDGDPANNDPGIAAPLP